MITQAKIVEAEIRPSKVNPDTMLLSLKFQPKEPLVRGDVEVEYLWYAVWNGEEWGKSFKRAELREALGLKPICFSQSEHLWIGMKIPVLSVPIFKDEDLPNLIGLELNLHIEEELYTPWGPRLRVMSSLPKEVP